MRYGLAFGWSIAPWVAVVVFAALLFLEFQMLFIALVLGVYFTVMFFLIAVLVDVGTAVAVIAFMIVFLVWNVIVAKLKSRSESDAALK